MKNTGIPLTMLPERYREQVMRDLHARQAPDYHEKMRKVCAIPVPKKRLRQNTTGPNKTEAAFVAWLKTQSCSQVEGLILEQRVTLLLGNGVRYTPDVFCPKPTPVFYEVKGFMRDDAAVKIKVAASLFPWWKFYLVTKRTKKQGGGWAIERVLP